MALKSDIYWANRAAERMEEYERNGLDTINVVRRAYDAAQARITADIDRLFDRFGRRFNLTPEEARAALNRIEAPDALESIRSQAIAMKDPELLARLSAPSFRHRINVLEALQDRTYIAVKSAARVELQATTEGLIETAKDAYVKACFDTQVIDGRGVVVEPLEMPEGGLPDYGKDRRLTELLSAKWSGTNYSERIWLNSEAVAKRIQDELSAGLLGGKPHDQIIADIADDFVATTWQAARLIRTEYSYIANAAQLQAYRDMDMPYYRFVAILDLKTSDICQKHDGLVFPVSNAQIGKNMPPLHPWCRSTTVALRDIEAGKRGFRMAKNPYTGESEKLPRDITYGEWYDKYVLSKKPKDPEKAKPV